MQLQGKQWLILGGSISIALSLLHIVVIFGGTPAYRYFGAGEEIAELAISGSILPALLTLFIATILALWGLYAFSGAGLIRRLPLLRLGLVIISSIYILRGTGVIPQVIWVIVAPQSIALREIVFSLVSLFTGIVYLIGTISSRERLKANHQTSPHENQQ